MPQSEFRINGKVFLDNNQTNVPDFIIDGIAEDPGGTADVFLARQPSANNRRVAIKRFGTNRLFEIYFEKEVRGLTGVYDKCRDVPVHLIATAKDQQYVVLEYAEITLWNEIETNQPLPVEDVYDIIKNITRKTACIHTEAGRIHRDLKPQNIFYLTKGNRETLRLGDFGSSTGDSHSMTFTHFPATFAYAAPEILSGESNGNAFTTDVFSLGMILYILLDGKEILPRQFDHMTCLNRNKTIADKIQQKIDQETYARRIDWETKPEIYGRYIALLKIACKALQPKPDERYADADEMLAHIETWENRLSVLELRTSQGDDRERVRVNLEYQKAASRNPADRKECAFDLLPEIPKTFYFPHAGRVSINASLSGWKPFEQRTDLTSGNPRKISVLLEKRGDINETYFYGSLLISLLILYPLILNTWASWKWGAHLPEFSPGVLTDWFSLTIWAVRIYLGEYGFFLAPLVILHYWSRKVDASNRLFGRRVGDFRGYVLINLLCIAYLYLILMVTAFEGPVLANNYGNYVENRFLSEFAENSREELEQQSWWVQRGLMLVLPCKKALCEKEYQVGARVLEKLGNNMPDKDAWDANRVFQAVDEITEDEAVREGLRRVLRGEGRVVQEKITEPEPAVVSVSDVTENEAAAVEAERKAQERLDELRRQEEAERRQRLAEEELKRQKELAEQEELNRQKWLAEEKYNEIKILLDKEKWEDAKEKVSDEAFSEQVQFLDAEKQTNVQGILDFFKEIEKGNVSSNDVQEFIKKLNQTERTDEYRLPTEAE